jgi:hypothetical protein
MTLGMKQGNFTSLPTNKSEQLVKNCYMTVNSNPPASQKLRKKPSVSKYFSFLACVIDTGD